MSPDRRFIACSLAFIAALVVLSGACIPFFGDDDEWGGNAHADTDNYDYPTESNGGCGADGAACGRVHIYGGVRRHIEHNRR